MKSDICHFVFFTQHTLKSRVSFENIFHLKQLMWYNWIGLEKDINSLCFWFFNFDLKHFKRVQSSEPLNTKMPQPSASLAHTFYRIHSSYWLAHFYLMKKSAQMLL
jgi:hypothetical protein